ncbi:hypothetical protein [Mesorhizobium sp.]|uniref:hypothetical protein n=1 Tax=Mesorhizobium sp. TaxID=1871066 RepID=UPI000FE96671|nr:hypothetical protein [Mesorhizobium sp.]RWK76244.1 MAG: hypothetical protein EOR50_14710 [Mesorhizobium sp.]RWK81042.1 MAG: hypothetical protein EOR51_16470 [Mesorhizobium sp.]RWL08363.1 MAG: hypothetical protein EOR55_04185 [Mesorhizobium sp.]RWL12161.1 MAG: hypothetical protein EOR56_15135 [Mesorhizobium sp.]
MTSEPVPGAVVAAVRVARSCLLDAQFRLDDHGYHCRLLDGLQDGAATLLAEWAGRDRPISAPDVPDFIAEAAREYRRWQKRTY